MTERSAVLPPEPAFVRQRGNRSPEATETTAPEMPRFQPLVRIALRDIPSSAAPAAETSAPMHEERLVPLPDVPMAPLAPAALPPLPDQPDVLVLREVDIEQITHVEAFGPQQDGRQKENRNSAEEISLAERTEAMQIAIPRIELTEADTAMLTAEGPVEMTVRVGTEAIGRVSFRMSEQRSIDVQLSGLLDLVSDRFDPGEFERLRASASAGSFVPIDQLREAGLNLRYDPVYDELRLSA